eukprot:6967639-Pyramimonas_sp.AAC.1
MRGMLETSQETLAGAPFATRGALQSAQRKSAWEEPGRTIGTLPKLCRSASRTLEPRTGAGGEPSTWSPPGTS